MKPLIRLLPSAYITWNIILNHLSLSSYVRILWNHSINAASGFSWYNWHADCSSLICARISNSFRFFSKFIQFSSVKSGFAVSTMVRSVRKVPRYGTVPAAVEYCNEVYICLNPTGQYWDHALEPGFRTPWVQLDVWQQVSWKYNNK